MVKKVLLGLGLTAVTCMASAQTPVFQEGFDAPQSKEQTEVGWYEFINTQEGDERNIVTEEDKQCLQFVNTDAVLCENQGWQRAVKFRNLPLQEGKIYQINFALKGSNTYVSGDNTPKCSMRLGLMQGYENSDISILGANGQDQTYTIDNFNEDAFVNYSRSFYFANKENQDAQYKSQGKDEAYINNYFTTFNIINPGTFYLDAVELVELANAVENITYGGDVIRVKYMLETNIATLAAAESIGCLILPKECATVSVNDAPEAVDCVELHKDGNLYIFLEEGYIEEAAKVVVTFTNPDGIVDLNNASNPGIFAFEAYEADGYDEDLANISSFAYMPAELVSSYPEDGSFRMKENIKEFTFTFDHEVYSVENSQNDGPKAVLSTGEELAVKAGTPELAKTITFVRTGAEDFTKGSYTITVSNIVTDREIAWEFDEVRKVTFEVGEVKVAETVYEDLMSVWIEGEYNTAQPTNGWIAYFNGEVGTSNANRVGNMITNGKGVGYYFCQRDASVPSKLTYGELEGYALTLPEADIQLSIHLTQWQGAGGSVNYALYQKDDMENAIAQGTAVGTANTANFGQEVSDMTVASVNIPGVKAGDYVLVLEQNSGWSGTILYGFDFKTYTMTEGEKNETEVIVDGRFADVADSHIPAAGSGWRIHRDGNIRTPGALVSWGGDCQCVTGGGGPRMFNLSYKNMAGKGVYLAGTNNVLTYGEFESYDDAEGNPQPEKMLELEAAKYQITYYSALWKAEGVKLTFEIIPWEQGFNGTPVYSRTDVINTKSPGGNAGDGSVEAMQTQFFWNCPKDGKYLIRFYTTDEGFVGNFTLETTASMAVQYTNLLRDALKPAIAELELANASDNYAGPTRDALDKAIKDYTNPDFHTIAEYTDAIAELGALVKAMSARRENIDKYPVCLQGILDAIEAAMGTKYEGLEAYPVVLACYNDYKDVDYIKLSDEALAEAVARMGNTGEMMKNMVNDCVPNFLIKQITDLAAMIIALDPDASGNDYVIAAGDAISDDQALVANLKKVYAAKLYRKIADGENPFEQYNEEEEITMDNPISAPALIQNAGFYTNAKKTSSGALANENSFPGWKIVITENSILADWGWGGPYNCSDVRPISDAAVCTAWGTSNVDVSQLVTNLPVVVYDVTIQVGDGTSTSEESLSYAYCKTAAMEEPLTIIAENDGGARSATDKTFPEITPDIADNLGSLTVGAVLRSRGDFSKCDNASLVMTGIVEGFKYDEAAAALEKETSVENITAAELGEPVAVELYNLNGVKVATLEAGSIAIKIEHFKNGFMKVSKVCVE